MNAGEDRPDVAERDRRAEVGAFLLGALVGAGIALLFAPGSGAQTQERLRNRAKQLGILAGDAVRGLRDDLGAHVESAKGVLGDGRQLAENARAELEDKLARSKAAYRAGLDAAKSTTRGSNR